MRTRFKSLLALGLTFAAGCFVGIVIGSSNPRWFKSFRAFIIKHFNEMAPLLDERQKAVAQEFLEKQLSRKMPPPPKEGKAN